MVDMENIADLPQEPRMRGRPREFDVDRVLDLALLPALLDALTERRRA
ncbi:hypothetical protein [Pararhizobium sp. O133]